MTAQANISDVTSNDQMAILSHAQIVPPAWGNVRKAQRNPAAFAAFVEDVKARGIIQSVTVRPHPTDAGLYELLAGFGRYEAARIAGCMIPALIRDVDDAGAVAIGLAENMQREDMNPVDEANAAKLALTVCKGDYEEAALKLNWNVVQLKKRLNLTRCSDAVQAALVAPSTPDFTLTLRHADLLAGISEEAQNKLLPEIINKKLSVSDLKALLGKASTPISSAAFDTTECGNCPHNTCQQHFLFDGFNTDEPMCRNLICFKQKHGEHCAKVRVDAEEKFGRVILLSEVNNNVIPEVAEASVGAEQYMDCLFCKNRVALLDDRLGKAAAVQESRCMDMACFTKCAQKLKAATQKVEAPTAGVKASSAATARPAQPAATKLSPAVGNTVKTGDNAASAKGEAALPSRIIEDNKATLRAAAVAAWGSTAESAQRLQTATVLASLLSVQGKIFTKTLPEVLKMSIDEIRQGIAQAVTAIATTQDLCGGWSVTDMLISTLPLAPEPQKHIVAAWTATPERLGLYTKEMIGLLLEESGFKAAYTAAHNEKGYKQLMDMPRTDRIKAIVSFNYDWSHYAPSVLFKTL